MDILAKSLLKTLKLNKLEKETLCAFSYQGKYLLGAFQPLVPHDIEITLIAHTSFAIPQSLIDSILPCVSGISFILL